MTQFHGQGHTDVGLFETQSPASSHWVWERLPQGVVIVGAAGEIVYANPAFGAFFDESPAEIAGGQIIDRIHPTDQLRWQNAFAASNDRGESLEACLVGGPRGAVPVRIDVGMVSGTGTVALFHDLSPHNGRLAQAYLTAVEESSDDAIVAKRLDGTITRWSPGAERMFGYTAEEIVGRSIATLLPPDEVAQEEELLARLMRGERIDHFETERVRKDGERITVLATISPIRDEAGRIVGASKVARDVTEQRKLEVLRTRLAAIVESSDDGIISKSPTGIVQTWNGGAEKIFGYTAEEAIGKSITLIIPEDRLHEETMILDRIRRGERVDHFRTVRRRKDGHLIRVSVTSSPIRDTNGTIIGASKIVRDITAHEQSMELRAHLASIVESSDDAIISKTLDGTITSWNRAAERIFGYRAEEIIGQSIKRLVPPDRIQEEEGILERLRRGERVDHFETVRLTKSGGLLDVSVTSSPIRDASGNVVGASKVARVITERKLAEMALRESEESLRGLTAALEARVRDRTAELQSALHEMEGFTYTISHDLRAPLRAIIANCRLLEEDFGENLPPEAHRYLSRQVDAARRLANLIDDLLRLSRIGRQPLARQDLDLSAMAHEIAAELAQRPEATSATFRIQPNLRAHADPTLLRLTLTNLLENATKFVRPGVPPIVEVGMEAGAFYVRDNGIGFEQEFEERLFLPFERLHRSVDYPGTGIGLANVKRIVERHGGRVWAVGQPGEGATFSFQLGHNRLGSAPAEG
jgi:PAS domain S-box-containing protein